MRLLLSKAQSLEQLPDVIIDEGTFKYVALPRLVLILLPYYISLTSPEYSPSLQDPCSSY